MTAQSLHRQRILAALSARSFPLEGTITVGEALDKCQLADITQIAWELDKANVKVATGALLAMALSRAVVRQIAEQFMLQEQLKQAKKAVTRTGDKPSA